MAYFNNTMPIYSIPTFDVKSGLLPSSVLNDERGSVLTDADCQPLANSDKYSFDIQDLKQVFPNTTQTLDHVTPEAAINLFLQWISEFHMPLWRPVYRKTIKFNVNRLHIELDGTKNDKYIIMKNLRVDMNTLETGDIIYAMPPLLSLLTRAKHHGYKITGEPNYVFIHPMLLTARDYEDLQYDLNLVTINSKNIKNVNLKENGRSSFKKCLSAEQMLQVARFLPKLEKVGVVRGPVDQQNCYYSTENTILYNQRFKLKYNI